jgi:hypothetical protein
MNGLLDYSQPTGSDWGSPITPALYDPFQEGAHQRPVRQQLANLIALEEQMARFEAEHALLVTEVRRYYVMPDELSVRDFLRNHRRIPPLLLEALPHLRRFFANTIFTLRATSDENGWQMLYVGALWPGEPRDALAALNQFDDAWWIANSYPAGTSLTFTYKLV